MAILEPDPVGALQQAIYENNIERILELLNQGYSIDSLENNGYTPLHIAVVYATQETISFLLKQGADINIQNNEGCTPLHIAAKHNRTECLESLLNHGAEINIQDKNGCTPLHIAAKHNRTECLESLLNHGAEINIQDKNGRTPLHTAAQYNRTENMESLLNHGAEINIQEKNGRTPLHLAVQERRKESMLTLLINQAKVDIMDKHGFSPIEYAETASIVVLWKIKVGEFPPHNIEDFDKLAGFKVSLLEQKQVLDYSDRDLEDSQLLQKLETLPQDFKCEALLVDSQKLKVIPNLRQFKQFNTLNALIILGRSVETWLGLPDDIKCIYCWSDLNLMARECFLGKGTCQVLVKSNEIYLGEMKQPPREIIRRGQDNVLHYYKRGHKVIHSRNRSALLGETTAGKTSLVRSLIKGSSDLTDIADRTQVVDIKEWHISESQIMMMVDQGGHAIYQICNPYFITDRSTLLIAHKLSDPTMTDRTKQVFRHILHQHQANKQVHFVLTHKDELTQEQCQKVHVDLQAKIRQVISNEIDKINRLEHSPDYPHKENLNHNLASCNEKLKSMQFFLVSSKSYEGVDKLRKFLISNIEKQMVSIPEHWIEFYEKLNSSEKHFLTRSEMVQILKPIKDFDDVSETFSDNILTCLHYFADCGLLLWHEHHHILQHYFFPDLTFLIQIFKSLLHHDLKSTLKYDGNTKLQITFQETELAETLRNYQQNGTLEHKLLSYLWKKYNLKSEDETVLIELIKIFHIFSEIHSELENLSCQQYFVPWLVQRNSPPEFLDKIQPMIFTKDTFTLALQCLFYNEIPLNVIEMFLVEIQRFAVENNYLGKRYAWIDGLHVKVGPKEIIAYKDDNMESMFLLVKCKTKRLQDAWSSFKTLYLSLKSILNSYPGAVRSLHTICGHCVLNKIDPPHKWLTKYVFPNKTSNNEFVTCAKDEDSEIPSALITYPADAQVSSQIEEMNKYLSECLSTVTDDQISTKQIPPTLSLEDDRKFDFNIIYRRDDAHSKQPSRINKFVDYLVSNLENKSEKYPNKRLRGFYAKRDMLPGKNIINQHFYLLKEAKYSILVLDKSFIEDNWAIFLGQSAFLEFIKEAPEVSGSTRLIPLAFGVSKEVIAKKCPQLNCLEVLYFDEDYETDDLKWDKVKMAITERLVTTGERSAFTPQSEATTDVIKPAQPENLTTSTPDHVTEQKESAQSFIPETRKTECGTNPSLQNAREAECGLDPSLQVSKVDTANVKVQLREIKQQQQQLIQGLSQQLSLYSQGISEKISHHSQVLSHQMHQQGRVLTNQQHLLSGDASQYPLNLCHPVLKSHQEELIDNMEPSDHFINTLIEKGILSLDDKKIITKEKAVLGRTKQILIRVEQFLSEDSSQITEFIDALNECGHGNNFILADKLKNTLNDHMKKSS